MNIPTHCPNCNQLLYMSNSFDKANVSKKFFCIDEKCNIRTFHSLCIYYENDEISHIQVVTISGGLSLMISRKRTTLYGTGKKSVAHLDYLVDVDINKSEEIEKKIKLLLTFS